MAELESPHLEEKKKLVKFIADKIKHSKTLLLASTKNLPSSQFHLIKKNLRGKAEIKVTRKTIMERAISSIERGPLQNLKAKLGSDIAFFFSNLDPFELSSLLTENQTPTKARAGDIAPEDISIEPGPTELMPGPAISELSSIGLKVAVEGGKIAIKQGAVVVKKGEAIKDNVASVLGKLNIQPMKVGFIPLVAYDATSEKIYENIIIDKKAALDELRTLITKALGFAINIGYPAKETIHFTIRKAAMEEKAIEHLLHKNPGEVKNE